VDICRKVGATHYYSSAGSQDYLDEEMDLFREASIPVTYQAWEHPVYPQRGGEFVSHLAALDALCHVGPEAARAFVEVKP
jgi:hypothetical protein